MWQNKKFPLWALFWGCILSAGISFIQARALNGMAADFITASAYLGLFLVVLVLNPILLSVKKRWALSSSDVLLIFIMGTIACVIPSWGLMGGLIPILGGFTYYSTSENQWETHILSHIKKFFIPTNSKAIEYYFTGMPLGAHHFPYSAWIIPLIVWFLFLMSFYFLLICIAVMLRKQWEENEKLTFPLTMLAGDMVKISDKSKIPLLFKNKIFWLGFGVAFLFTSLTILPSYFPVFPQTILGKGIPIFRNTTTLMFVLSWPIVGFAYLVNLNITFSLWTFQLLSKIETGWFNITGYTIPGGAGGIFAAGSPMVSFQAAGAVIVLVIFLLWQARKHLGNVFRKAIYKDNNIDDSAEILSYRTVIFGGALSILIIGIFFHLMGMPLIVIFVYLFYLLVTFIGLNRFICQAGLGFVRSQCDPPGFTSYVLPSQSIGTSGYIGLGLQYPYAGDIRTTVLTSTQNSLKLNDQARINPRVIFLAIVIALVIAYVVAAFSNLQSGYMHGELNARAGWFSQYFPVDVGNFISNKINNPPTKQMIIDRYVFMGIGGAIMALLIFFQNTFLWWPLHYIGFPFADSLPIDRGWFSIFIAWLIKFLILKYGGVQLYRRSIPFFYGVILGGILAAGTWMGIGAIYQVVTGQTAQFPYFGI